MTEERKQELRQLLCEAMQSVIIEAPEGYKPMSVEKYGEDAKAFRKSYRPDLSFILDYRLNIQDKAVESKLFNFMKEELANYIREDESFYPPYTHWTQIAKNAIRGTSRLIPFPLNSLLEKFLEIAIANGAEQAILILDRCTRDRIGTFQKIIFLQGLLVRYSGTNRDTHETQVAEGIKLVQLPTPSEDLPPYLFHERLIPHLFHERSIPNSFHESFIPMADNTRFSIFSGALLLIIDYTVSPLFCKPSIKRLDSKLLVSELERSDDRFQIKIKSAEFPNFDVNKFYQALSLIANCAVKPLFQWQYIGEDELFNVKDRLPLEMKNLVMPDYRSGIGVINETDIDKAKCLYQLLTNPSSNIGKKLQIPIDRWIKSKTSQTPEDKIIDLGIAFEALYLSDISKPTELSFRLRLHAAWHLKKKKEDRKALMKEFSEIYRWRSTVVHTGKLPNKTRRTPFTPEEVEAFITNTQNLCRASIMKILEDGKFPDDWNSLILGADSL